MALELRQQLKLSQQLVMTPQLQQAIRLLQLSRLELVETVQRELLENPFLEEIQDEPSNEPPPQKSAPNPHAMSLHTIGKWPAPKTGKTISENSQVPRSKSSPETMNSPKK